MGLIILRVIKQGPLGLSYEAIRCGKNLDTVNGTGYFEYGRQVCYYNKFNSSLLPLCHSHLLKLIHETFSNDSTLESIVTKKSPIEGFEGFDVVAYSILESRIETCK